MILIGYWASQEQILYAKPARICWSKSKWADLHLSLQVITFILGGMTMDLGILHGFGWRQSPNV